MFDFVHNFIIKLAFFISGYCEVKWNVQSSYQTQRTLNSRAQLSFPCPNVAIDVLWMLYRVEDAPVYL